MKNPFALLTQSKHDVQSHRSIDDAAGTCPTCGKETLPRINRQHFQQELTSKWFKKGFSNTFIGLTIAPGKQIYTYINVNRDDLIKPIVYLLTTMVMLLWSYHLLNANTNSAEETLVDQIERNMHFIQLSQAVAMAYVMLKFTYKDRGYNFYEYTTLMVYLLAQCLIFASGYNILQHYFPDTQFAYLRFFTYFIYCSWGIAQFFAAKTLSDFFKAASTYILGVALTFVAAIVLLSMFWLALDLLIS